MKYVYLFAKKQVVLLLCFVINGCLINSVQSVRFEIKIFNLVNLRKEVVVALITITRYNVGIRMEYTVFPYCCLTYIYY